MSALGARLAVLEQRRTAPVCPTCGTWPAFQWRGDDGALLAGAPALACPQCGRLVVCCVYRGAPSTWGDPDRVQHRLPHAAADELTLIERGERVASLLDRAERRAAAQGES